MRWAAAHFPTKLHHDFKEVESMFMTKKQISWAYRDSKDGDETTETAAFFEFSSKADFNQAC